MLIQNSTGTSARLQYPGQYQCQCKLQIPDENKCICWCCGLWKETYESPASLNEQVCHIPTTTQTTKSITIYATLETSWVVWLPVQVL